DYRLVPLKNHPLAEKEQQMDQAAIRPDLVVHAAEALNLCPPAAKLLFDAHDRYGNGLARAFKPRDKVRVQRVSIVGKDREVIGINEDHAWSRRSFAGLRRFLRRSASRSF